MAQAATHPTAAVFGSPANSLGSVLSQFFSHRTKNLSRKSKTPPKPQRKRHCRFRFLILRQLSPSGLGRTRSWLAPTASANRFVRSSLRYLQPLSQRWLRAVFPRTIHYCQQVLSKEEKQNSCILPPSLSSSTFNQLLQFGWMLIFIIKSAQNPTHGQSFNHKNRAKPTQCRVCFFLLTEITEILWKICLRKGQVKHYSNT